MSRAVVHAEPLPDAVAFEADDGGRFDLCVKPGPLTLEAIAADFAPARWFGVAPNRDVRIQLLPASVLQGRVLGVEGNPEPDIEVRALPQRGPGWMRLQSRTDQDGRFEIRNLPPGRYAVVATGERKRGAVSDVAVPLEGATSGVLIRATKEASVDGQVIGAAKDEPPCDRGVVSLSPAATPKAGRPLSLAEEGSAPMSAFSADIGANGSVHFQAVPPGEYRTRVRCRGHVTVDGPALLSVGTDPQRGFVWRVARGADLTVVTSDDRDRPLPRASFVLHALRPDAEVGHEPPIMKLGQTDETGVKRISGELEAGLYELTAASGFEANPVRIDLRDALFHGRLQTTANLKFSASGTIAVEIRDEHGVAVDDMVVTAMRSGEGPERTAEPSMPAGLPRPPSPSPFVATALGEGRYRIRPLRSGRYDVTAQDATQLVRSAAVVAEGPSDDGEPPVTLVVDRTGEVSGQLVDDRGAPVSSAWVSLELPATEEPRSPFVQTLIGGKRKVLTGPSGRFSFGELASTHRYALEIETPGGAIDKRTVSPGASVREVIAGR